MGILELLNIPLHPSNNSHPCMHQVKQHYNYWAPSKYQDHLFQSFFLIHYDKSLYPQSQSAFPNAFHNDLASYLIPLPTLSSTNSHDKHLGLDEAQLHPYIMSMARHFMPSIVGFSQVFKSIQSCHHRTGLIWEFGPGSRHINMSKFIILIRWTE